MNDIETFREFCKNNTCSICRFKEIAIDTGCSNCEKHFMKEHDAQIRADAIDECIEALGNNIWDIAKLEQLKEQK